MRRVKLLSLITLSVFVLSIFATSGSVNALSGNDFKAGRIIDDSIFFNANTMSVSDIQGFLNSKVPVCDTYHSSSYGNPQPPYTCLKDYRENTQTHENNLEGRSAPNGSISAAQIIWNAAQQYSINPQVLLVKLQKEQSLITDTWPWPSQYRSAMGYACPDTAPCDAEYYGFYNQVDSAAWQLKRYVDSPNSFNYAVGQRYVGYNPNAACGGTNITIETRATAALYNYTPYQPNQAALNNLYGTGDGCSAYGNRNFWRLFSDWFGPTTNNSAVHRLNFLRLNHPSGNVELIGYSSLSSYTYMTQNGTTGYPAVAADGSVLPSPFMS